MMAELLHKRRFMQTNNKFSQVCFSMVGPFRDYIRVGLRYQTSSSERYDNVDLKMPSSDKKIRCVNLKELILTNSWLFNTRKMTALTFLKVYRIGFHRNSSYLPELGTYIDNFWIGKQELKCKQIIKHLCKKVNLPCFFGNGNFGFLTSKFSSVYMRMINIQD